MPRLCISEWIFEGKPLYDIQLGSNLQDAIKKINSKKPLLQGNNLDGYYYLLNGFRIGFRNNLVDEIGVDLNYSNCDVFLSKDGYEINLSTSKIHEVLNYLNDTFILWSINQTLDSQHIIIELSNKKIYFIFDIYEGSIEKISMPQFEFSM